LHLPEVFKFVLPETSRIQCQGIRKPPDRILCMGIG